MDSQEKYNKPFPSRLRSLIDERKTTITAVAAKLEISRQAVSQYCDGTGQPNAEKLSLICNYFNVSADYLLGRTDVKTPDVDRRAMCEYTGLWDSAFSWLSNAKTANPERIEVLNVLFNDDLIDLLLSSLYLYSHSQWIELTTRNTLTDEKPHKCDRDESKAMLKFNAQESLALILDRLYSIFYDQAIEAGKARIAEMELEGERLQAEISQINRNIKEGQ